MHDSHSLRGMKQWTRITDVKRRSNTAAGVATYTNRSDISNLAYDVYKKHVMHAELRSVASSFNVPSNRDARRIRRNISANNPDMTWVPQGNFSHFAVANPGSAQELRNARAKATVNQSGQSARFSLTTDSFLNPTVNARGGLNTEYGRLANTVADWVKDPKAYKGKVMTPNALSAGRGDHAVLYSRALNPTERQNTANTLSSKLNAPSDYTPLGMDNPAKGVAYAELIRTQKHSVLGSELKYAPPGYGGVANAESSSFGENRAHIIAEAIDRHRHGGAASDLNTHLGNAIARHGYDAQNPALISDAAKKRLKLNEVASKQIGLKATMQQNLVNSVQQQQLQKAQDRQRELRNNMHRELANPVQERRLQRIENQQQQRVAPMQRELVQRVRQQRMQNIETQQRSNKTAMQQQLLNKVNRL